MLRQFGIGFLCLWICACGSSKGSTTSPHKDDDPRTAESEAESGSAFQIEIREVAGPVQPEWPVAAATVRPLSADEGQIVWRGISPPKKPVGLASTSAIESERAAPKVKAYQSLKVSSFDALNTLNEDQDQVPLEVLRHGPVGDAASVKRVSLTFSKPMVALSGQQAILGEEAPALLEPTIDGTWKWIGTSTLVFEGRDRLAMATNYRVRLKPQIQSIDGSVLSDPFEYGFKTAPLEIVFHKWLKNLAHRPIFIVRFNQGVDPDVVVDHLVLTGPKGAQKFEVVSPEDLADESAEVRWYLDRVTEVDRHGRRTWMVVRADQPIADSGTYKLVFKRGARGGEGPLPTLKEQETEVVSFKPLVLSSSWCARGCRPEDRFAFNMSGAVDDSTCPADEFLVEPPVEGFGVQIEHNQIAFTGTFRPKTDYSITLPKGCSDEYGQRVTGTRQGLISVKAATPLLEAPGNGTVVLSTSVESTIRFWGQGIENVEAKVYAANPEQWFQFQEWREKRRNGVRSPNAPPPGEFLTPKHPMVPDALAQGRAEIDIDLKNQLAGAHRSLIVWVTSRGADSKNRYQRQEASAWIQISDLQVHSCSDANSLTAWVTSIATGKPVEGARVYLADLKKMQSKEVLTDQDGIAQIKLSSGRGKSGSNWLVVEKGNESVFAVSKELSQRPIKIGWSSRNPKPKPMWSANTDRGAYGPGETVHVHGWMRFMEPAEGVDLRLPRHNERRVQWELDLPGAPQARRGELKLTKNGGFELKIDLPQDTSLGSALLTFKSPVRPEDSLWIAFGIARFPMPSFDVEVGAESHSHFLGQVLRVHSRAQYFDGAPLVGGEAHWRIEVENGHHTPRGQEEFVFGRISKSQPAPWVAIRYNYKTLVGRTDALGQHALEIDLKSDQPVDPLMVRVISTVTDVNNQQLSKTREFLLHPSSYYIGLKSRGMVRTTEGLDVDWVVSGLDGLPIASVPGVVELYRVNNSKGSSDTDGSYQLVDQCDGRSGTEPVACTFKSLEAGTYTLVASVTDPQGRMGRSESQVLVIAPGPDASEKNSLDGAPKVSWSFDKSAYNVGETARVAIETDVFPATAWITHHREGVVGSHVVLLENGKNLVELPVGAGQVPHSTLKLVVVGAGGMGRVGAASHTLRVHDPKTELQVSLSVDNHVTAPGAKNRVEAVVRDRSGRPVRGAEVALWVVDESYLALTEYRAWRPEELFFKDREAGSRLHPFFVVGSKILPEEEVSRTQKAQVPLLLAYERRRQSHRKSKNSLRVDSRPVVIFRANVKTNGEGVVSSNFTMPDTMTRYRVVAVAAAGDYQFGSAISSISVEKSLTVFPLAPRFVKLGDRFELPVVIQNWSDQPQDVNVAGRSPGLRWGKDGKRSLGYRTTLQARSRALVNFPVSARSTGPLDYQVGASISGTQDAYGGTLNVGLPTEIQTSATFGVIQKGSVGLKLLPPEDVLADAGGLEVIVSSSRFESLTDALVDLIHHPYDGAEPLASRLLATIAMSDVIRHVRSSNMIEPKTYNALIARTVARLASFQRKDGGFGYWRGRDASDPFLSVHVAHALARAHDANFLNNKEVLDRALEYTDGIVGQEKVYGSEQVDLAVRSYGIYALQVAGYPELKVAAPMVASRPLEEIPDEALGWLLPTFAMANQDGEVRRILRHLGKRLVEEKKTATFSADYSDGAHWVLPSRARATAVITEALVDADPYNSALPKLVEGLLAQRHGGRWASTLDNAFAILAIKNYFDSFVSRHPHFDARVWVGDSLVLQDQYRRRTPRQSIARVKMADLLAQKEPTRVLIEKDGVERMYYRAAFTYALAAPPTEPVNRGFDIERRYEPVEHPGDVVRQSDGSWWIRAGCRVRVVLNLFATRDRHHVALLEHFPGGLQPIDPTVGGPIVVMQTSATSGQFVRQQQWYQHQNLRGDRLEVFATSMPVGFYQYSYYARAATEGTYYAKAAKVEEIYRPETFGASAPARVTIETENE